MSAAEKIDAQIVKQAGDQVVDSILEPMERLTCGQAEEVDHLARSVVLNEVWWSVSIQVWGVIRAQAQEDDNGQSRRHH